MTNLLNELERFKNITKKLSSCTSSKVLEDGHVLSICSKNLNNNNRKNIEECESYDLCFSTLIHGNEVVGLWAINDFLEDVLLKDFTIDFNLLIIIGNRKAGIVDKRFLDRDLNRCFGAINNELYEEKLAKRLEPFLKKSNVVIDLHQTIEKSESPFFILEHDERSLKLSEFLCSELPIVTAKVVKNENSIKNGTTLNDYARIHGNIATTIEFGQKGFDIYQKYLCRFIIERAIKFIKKTSIEYSYRDKKYFTWERPSHFCNENSQLTEKFNNFQFIEKGTLIGIVDGENIYAKRKGYIMFPKYNFVSNPKEPLYRMLKEVDRNYFD